MLHVCEWPFPSNAMVFWYRLHPFIVVELMADKNLFGARIPPPAGAGDAIRIVRSDGRTPAGEGSLK
jgi:hypothetical protein